MCTWVPAGRIGHNRWLSCLHLFYVALFAFVLPLICWGVQATPGHPHAKAHFVFADPPVLVSTSHRMAIENVTEWLAHFGRSVLCAPGVAAQTAAEAIERAPVPVGRSVPSQLASTLLLATGLIGTVWLSKADRVEFPQWVVLPESVSFILLLATPPPR